MRNLYLLFFLFLPFSSHAQLVEGTVMFVGFNADGSDGFAIVSLVDIPASSTIYFSDNEWNGSVIGLGGAFINTTEGELTWSTGASIISAGTVVLFNETASSSNPGYGSSIGTISGIINLNASNEVLYAFLGSGDETPTQFLSAITNSGFNMTDGTLLGTGLVDLVSAITIVGDPDIMVYNGLSICNTTVSACAALIGLPSNWTTDDGPGDQSNDGNTPNFPDDVPPSFSGSALPIELNTFQVTETIDKNVLIEWVTLSEVNNDYFTIERSIDNAVWKVVGNLEGAGNSVVKRSYSFIDFSVQTGISYYRLKQTDFDGKFSYSSTEVINLKTDVYELIYPNPTRGILHISGVRSKNLPIRLTSITGVDYSNVLIFTDGAEENTIDLSSMSNGIYFLQIGSVSHRIIKQ